MHYVKRILTTENQTCAIRPTAIQSNISLSKCRPPDTKWRPPDRNNTSHQLKYTSLYLKCTSLLTRNTFHPL